MYREVAVDGRVGHVAEGAVEVAFKAAMYSALGVEMASRPPLLRTRWISARQISGAIKCART